MSEPLISRVYDIRVSSFDDSIRKVETLTAAFKAMDEAKTKLNAQLQQKVTAGDDTSVADLTKKIKDLETEMSKLKTQRDSSAKEAALLAKAEKDTAAALLLTEKATVAVATSEKIRAQTSIALNAEKQRQLDLDEKQRIKLENEKKAVDALEGSYLALKNQRQQLEALLARTTPGQTITFNNQQFNFDEAISKIKEMKVQELAFTEQLQIEKTVHDNINKSQQDEISSIRRQRTELEALVNEAHQKSSFSFGAESFTNDQAIAKITELRNQEQLLTEQLNNEKSIRQTITLGEEQKLNTIRQEIAELEKLISTSSETSTISLGGQNLNFSQALTQLQQLKTAEEDFTQKLNVERNVQDQITATEQQKIIAIREQRTALESLLSINQQKLSATGTSFNNDEALAKVTQLREQEQLLTDQLNNEKTVRQSIIQTEEQKLAVIRQERTELESLVSSSDKSSTIDFKGQSFSQNEAVDKIKQLRNLEQDYIQQLQLEKTAHDQITQSQERSISALRQEREELETLLSKSGQTQSITVGSQFLTNDEALSKIEQLRSEEQQLTQQLLNEKTVRASLIQEDEQRLSVIKQQRIELENRTSTSSGSSFTGNTDFSNALAQIAQLKAEETDLIEKLRIEKSVQDSIVVTEEQKIAAIRQQRAELDTQVQNKTESSTVSFQGQTLNTSEAIAKIQQLKIAEDELIKANGTEQQSSDAVARAQQRLAAAQSDTGKTVAELNLQTQLANKANKEIAQNTLGLIDTYGQLKIQYNEAAAAAKNLAAVALKTGDAGDIAAAESATTKAKALHDSVLQIETGVGQAQRNVGNYTGALKILETSLTEAKQKLDSMTQSERENTVAGQSLEKEVSLLSTLAGQQSQGFTSLRREVLNATQALATLEEQGLQGTPAFEQLQTEVANARRGLVEFNNQQKLLSSEVPSIAALTSVAKGLGAAYAFGAGTAQLFGDNNEKSAEKLNKLVAVMTLLQGLTELNRTLQERTAIATALTGLKEQALTGYLILKNFALTGSIGLTKADILAKQAEAAATEGVSTANKIAAASFVALRTALIATGIGALLILLTASALAMSHLAENAEIAREKISVLNEVNTKAIEGFVEQKIKVDDLVSAVNNSNASLETRKDKLNELIALSPQYLSGLTLENLHTAEGVKILGDYNNALQKKAELEAAQSAQVDAAKDIAKLNVVKQEIQDAIKNGAKAGFNDFSKEAAEFINTNSTSAGRTSFTSSLFNLSVSKSDLQQALSDVQTEINKAQNKVIASNEVFTSKLTASLSLGDAPKTIEEQYKQIETIRDKALSIENTNTAETERTRALSLNEEKAHLLNVEKINVDALNEKIAVVQKNKTLNDQQQKDLASFEEQRANIQLETSKKIQELNKQSQKSSRLDLDESEQIKLIEANRDKLLAVENTSVNQIELIRQLSFTEEKQHLINVEQINVDALNQKIELLDRKKKLNAEEARDRALFGEQITSIELETSQKIDAINKKQFDEESKSLKKQFETQKSQVDVALSFVLVDRSSSFEDKAIAKKNADQAIFNETVAYYNSLESLAIKDKQKTTDIEQEKQKAIADLIKISFADNIAESEAGYKDIEASTENAINRIKRKFDALRSIKPGQDTTQLDLAENIQTISAKLAGDNQLLDKAERDIEKLEIAKDNLAAGLISKQNFDVISSATLSEKDYDSIVGKVKRDQADLASLVGKNITRVTDLKSLITNSVQSLFSFGNAKADANKLSQASNDLADGKISQQAFDDVSKSIQKNITLRELFAQTMQESFATAQTAMNDYFSAEQQQIERSNRLTQQRLDIELNQAKARAQSQAEADSLDRQFAARKTAADKEAFEKNKKNQIEQVKVNAALSLSNLAVIALSPGPLNIVTLGVAGQIMYAVQAALILVNEALNIGRIRSAQFAAAKGGKVPNLSSGRITHASNIPTQPNGDNILATVKTDEVILNEEQQRKLGGAKVFRNIGVPGFAAGGSVGTASTNSTETTNSTEATKRRIDIFGLIKGEHKEILKFIDDQRERRIEREMLRFKESRIDETQYLRNVFAINNETANTKIKFLETDIQKISARNKSDVHESEIATEQKRKITELRAYTIEQEAETNRQIFNLQKSKLDHHYETIRKNAEFEMRKVNLDMLTSSKAKELAIENYKLHKELTQIFYEHDLARLENTYYQHSESRDKKESRASNVSNVQVDNRVTKTDDGTTAISTLQSKEFSRSVAETRSNYLSNGHLSNSQAITRDRISKILQDDSVSTKEKASKIYRVERSETRSLLTLNREIAQSALKSKEDELRHSSTSGHSSTSSASSTSQAEVIEARTKLRYAELALSKHVSEDKNSFLSYLKNGFVNSFNRVSELFSKSAKDSAQTARVIVHQSNQSVQNSGKGVRKNSKTVQNFDTSVNQSGTSSVNSKSESRETKQENEEYFSGKNVNIFSSKMGKDYGLSRHEIVINASSLKNDVTDFVKNTVSEAKSSFFQNKSNEINRRNDLAITGIKSEYRDSALSENYSERNTAYESLISSIAEKHKSSRAEQNKSVLEEVAINFHHDVITAKEKYPGPLSVIPVTRLTRNYNETVNSIAHQEFASGGAIEPKLLPHGLINIATNIPERDNGDNILAFVRRKEVILNEEQQRKAGGPAFFRSIGVPGFASGGKASVNYERMSNYYAKSFATGGFAGIGDLKLGDDLLPPVNPSSFLNPKSTSASNDTSKIFEAIDKQTENINALARQVNQRFDKIKVQVVTGEITDSQNKIKKASAIGTL